MDISSWPEYTIFAILFMPILVLMNLLLFSGSSNGKQVPPSPIYTKLFLFLKKQNGSSSSTYPSLSLQVPFNSLDNINGYKYCSNMTSSQASSQKLSVEKTQQLNSNGKCNTYLSANHLKNQSNGNSANIMKAIQLSVNWFKLQSIYNILKIYSNSTPKFSTYTKSARKLIKTKSDSKNNTLSKVSSWCGITRPNYGAFLLRNEHTISTPKCYLIPTKGVIWLTSSRITTNGTSIPSSGKIQGYIRYTLFGWNKSPIIIKSKKRYLSIVLFQPIKFQFNSSSTNSSSKKQNGSCDLNALLSKYSERSLQWSSDLSTCKP